MSFAAYIARAVSALIIMSVCAVLIVKYFRKHNINNSSKTHAQILSSLRLTARDIFFVVRCGPDVIAFTLGPHGVCLMGRWNYNEWLNSQNNDEVL